VVLHQLQKKYAHRFGGPVSVRRGEQEGPGCSLCVEDPENAGPAIAGIVAKRRIELGSIADAEFECERDARQYADSLRQSV